jgi:hypothetical protein
VSAFCFIFENSILVMCANGTKSYLLILAVNLIKKSFVSKGTVIGVVVYDCSTSLSHDLLKCLHRQNSLIDGEIPYQVNVDKVAHMIAESCASPNTVTSEEF